MTPKELADALQRAFDQGLDSVPLVLARRPMPRGERVRLAGRGTPLGEILTVNRDGRIVARFDAIEVAAWATSIGVLSAYVARVKVPQ